MQLNHTPLLLMAFLAIGSAQAFGQERDLLSAEYSKCIEKSGGTDPGMLDCMGAEAERQDKRLNDVYRKLMNELKPERKKELQEAQRLWIKYTQENCNFYLDPDGGTAARLAASECPVLAKAARAKELENFIKLPNKPHQMTWDQLTWDRGVKLVDSLGSSLRLW
jgi:uncharacterized protein YecT (DUF1311 family)